MNAGLPAFSWVSMFAWKLVGEPEDGGAPAAFCAAEKPWIALRIEAYAPWRSAPRFQEYSTSFEVTGSPLENLAAGFR